jgi:hypothetical protein
MGIVEKYLAGKLTRLEEIRDSAVTRLRAAAELGGSKSFEDIEKIRHDAETRTASKIYGRLLGIKSFCNCAMVYGQIFKKEILLASVIALSAVGFMATRQKSSPTPIPTHHAPVINESDEIIWPKSDEEFIHDSLNNENLRKAMGVGEESPLPKSDASKDMDNFVKEFTDMMHRQGERMERRMNQPRPPEGP